MQVSPEGAVLEHRHEGRFMPYPRLSNAKHKRVHDLTQVSQDDDKIIVKLTREAEGMYNVFGLMSADEFLWL